MNLGFWRLLIYIYIYIIFYGHTSFRIISMISLLSRFGIPDIAYLLASLGASCGRLPTSGRLRAVRSKCEELYQAHAGARFCAGFVCVGPNLVWRSACRFLCPKRNNDLKPTKARNTPKSMVTAVVSVIPRVGTFHHAYPLVIQQFAMENGPFTSMFYLFFHGDFPVRKLALSPAGSLCPKWLNPLPACQSSRRRSTRLRPSRGTWKTSGCFLRLC